MSGYQEKRRHPRSGIEWPAEITTAGGSISGQMKNISVSGAYVQCSPLPPIGEIVSVTVRPQRSKSIVIAAEVIWTAASPPFGMGMAFTEISEEDRWFISETVARAKAPD